MAKYNDPKTGKTVEASNPKEAQKALAPKKVVKKKAEKE